MTDLLHVAVTAWLAFVLLILIVVFVAMMIYIPGAWSWSPMEVIR